jgi:mycothiol synthase
MLIFAWLTLMLQKVENYITSRKERTNTMSHNPYIEVPDAPSLPGLTFRHFRGESDYPGMVAVLEGSKEADQLQYSISLENIINEFNHLYNCDPYKDMLFAEMDHQVIGYTWVWWEETDETWICPHVVYILPEWRNKGIRRAMLHYNEKRAKEIASGPPTGKPRFFQAWAQGTETHWISVLTTENYSPVRYGFHMARSLEEDIPDLPLPDGIEVRPARTEDYWTIWRAAKKALQDLWEGSRFRDEFFEEFMDDPTFNPGLWAIAWDTNTGQVVGTVMNYIDEAENKEFDRKRGHLEFVSVQRPYRGKGLAKALIARSFKILKDQGMTEAALGVDAENPSGALRLYERMGFHKVRQRIIYRKPMTK